MTEIKPGDPSIRKAFDRICPRQGGEQVPVWHFRIGRVLGWPTSRVTTLYKDRRCKLSAAESLQLREALGGAAQSQPKSCSPAGASQNYNRLLSAQARSEELNELIEDIANDVTHAALRHWAEALLESLPRAGR